MPEKKNIVVVGAGVVGLTTALVLARKGKYNIAIAAKHMPGDYDEEYASPWAGANSWPVSAAGTEEAERDKISFLELWRLATEVPEAGVHVMDSMIYKRAKDEDKNTPITEWTQELLSASPWFKDLYPDFRTLSQSELPPGISSGTAFKSVCINPPIYLAWLCSHLLRLGVTLQRAVLSHILDARSLHPSGPADLIINCTGLSSYHLGGVCDHKLAPIRGQVVMVRNIPNPPAMVTVSGTDDGDDELTYCMTRACGGGTTLGGCYQKGNWDGMVDKAMAERIMKRAVEAVPGLVKEGEGIEGLSVIRHGVGLRPWREGGARIERDLVDGVDIVHNYGAGGFGYQASYGMADKAARLAEGALAEQRGVTSKL